MVQTLGFVAGTLTAIAFLPQVVKTWRTRSASDLSTAMLLAQSAGVALWIVYGVAIGSLPVIMANVVTLVLALLLLAFKTARRTALSPVGTRLARPPAPGADAAD